VYETGGMKRIHLTQHNIIKRLLIHSSAFNLGLAMRKMTGYGTPRGLQGRMSLFDSALRVFLRRSQTFCAALRCLRYRKSMAVARNVQGRSDAILHTWCSPVSIRSLFRKSVPPRAARASDKASCLRTPESRAGQSRGHIQIS
jgi:hypothetical protein